MNREVLELLLRFKHKCCYTSLKDEAELVLSYIVTWFIWYITNGLWKKHVLCSPTRMVLFTTINLFLASIAVALCVCVSHQKWSPTWRSNKNTANLQSY